MLFNQTGDMICGRVMEKGSGEWGLENSSLQLVTSSPHFHHESKCSWHCGFSLTWILGFLCVCLFLVFFQDPWVIHKIQDSLGIYLLVNTFTMSLIHIHNEWFSREIMHCFCAVHIMLENNRPKWLVKICRSVY